MSCFVCFVRVTCCPSVLSSYRPTIINNARPRAHLGRCTLVGKYYPCPEAFAHTETLPGWLTVRVVIGSGRIPAFFRFKHSRWNELQYVHLVNGLKFGLFTEIICNRLSCCDFLQEFFASFYIDCRRGCVWKCIVSIKPSEQNVRLFKSQKVRASNKSKYSYKIYFSFPEWDLQITVAFYYKHEYHLICE